MNMKKLMQQVKQMQSGYQKKISEFEDQEFEFDYKKSIIIKIKGNLQILDINIDKTLIDPDDKIMLQEMIAEAINEAISSIEEEKQKITESISPIF